MFRRAFLIFISVSLSLGDDVMDNSENRTFSLSLYGGGIVNGTWMTAFQMDKKSENISTLWNLRLNYSVSGHGSNRRLSVKGLFIDDGVATTDPISIRLLPVQAKEESVSGENCYYNEDGEAILLKIVSREQWNATEFKGRLKTRSRPAEYVILDAAGPTVGYASTLLEAYAHELGHFGGLSFNFFIGVDGAVYEGLGWDYITNVQDGGLGKWDLMIHFVKNDRHDSPSPSAVESLKALLKAAVCLGKLSKDYKLIPYHLIYEYRPLIDDHFEKKALKEWDHYGYQIDVGMNNAGQFPIAFREEYNWRKPSTRLVSLQLQIDYVVVRNVGFRCFTSEGCLLQSKLYRHGSNFYVGDDGRAYEDLGWDYESVEHWKGKRAIEVSFFGQHYSYAPSRSAMIAFNGLVRLGVLWKKISPNYKVISIRKINKNYYVGDKLEEVIKDMERYTDDVSR